MCLSPLSSYLSTYLSSFFSLPVNRHTGEKLSHEQVINQLDDETVSYEAAFGISDAFTENFRVSIKVEVSAYEKAVAWLRDLIYGSEFTKERRVHPDFLLFRVCYILLLNNSRLQVNVAKIQQALPELKRDGSNVLSSLWATVVYGDNNTSRANSILTQIDFVQTLVRELQQDPDKVIATFNEIRKHS